MLKAADVVARAVHICKRHAPDILADGMLDAFVLGYVIEIGVGHRIVTVHGTALLDVLSGESLQGIGLGIGHDLGGDLAGLAVLGASDRRLAYGAPAGMQLLVRVLVRFLSAEERLVNLDGVPVQAGSLFPGLSCGSRLRNISLDPSIREEARYTSHQKDRNIRTSSVPRNGAFYERINHTFSDPRTRTGGLPPYPSLPDKARPALISDIACPPK